MYTVLALMVTGEMIARHHVKQIVDLATKFLEFVEVVKADIGMNTAIGIAQIIAALHHVLK